MGEGKFSGITGICPLPKVLCGYQLLQDVQYGIGPVVQISKMFEVSFISVKIIMLSKDIFPGVRCDQFFEIFHLSWIMIEMSGFFMLIGMVLSWFKKKFWFVNIN